MKNRFKSILKIAIFWLFIMVIISGSFVSCSDDDLDGNRKNELEKEPSYPRVYPSLPYDVQEIDNQGNPIN